MSSTINKYFISTEKTNKQIEGNPKGNIFKRALNRQKQVVQFTASENSPLSEIDSSVDGPKCRIAELESENVTLTQKNELLERKLIDAKIENEKITKKYNNLKTKHFNAYIPSEIHEIRSAQKSTEKISCYSIAETIGGKT